MSRFAQALQSGRFIVTSELNPPKGIELAPLLDKAAALGGWVDALNVTDCAGAHMAMAPTAVCHLLQQQNVEPIMQLTSRDRNRIALQADMLGAAALGVRNLLVMGGDPPSAGDHPQAKPVFDLYASQIIEAASALGDGHDLGGHALHGTPPRFCVGAVVNPGADDHASEYQRMREKITAGARFLQTQAVYDTDAYRRFVDGAGALDTPLLAGIIPLKSLKMAQFLNDRIPGITVPAALMRELETAADMRAAAIDVAVRTIEAIRGYCRGVHIMAIGWEEVIPAILEAAGVGRER